MINLLPLITTVVSGIAISALWALAGRAVS